MVDGKSLKFTTLFACCVLSAPVAADTVFGVYAGDSFGKRIRQAVSAVLITIQILPSTTSNKAVITLRWSIRSRYSRI